MLFAISFKLEISFHLSFIDLETSFSVAHERIRVFSTNFKFLFEFKGSLRFKFHNRGSCTLSYANWIHLLNSIHYFAIIIVFFTGQRLVRNSCFHISKIMRLPVRIYFYHWRFFICEIDSRIVIVIKFLPWVWKFRENVNIIFAI